MSTRATIEFRSEYETFFVYRHCDGYPEQIMPDIESVIDKARGRWSDPECGMLVSFFLGSHFKATERLPDYMMTESFHGDESYRYFVQWDGDKKQWIVSVGNRAVE